MPNPSDRFQLLANQFDTLVESLNESSILEERRDLLRQMKILLDEIDGLGFLFFEANVPRPSPPDQAIAKS